MKYLFVLQIWRAVDNSNSPDELVHSDTITVFKKHLVRHLNVEERLSRFTNSYFVALSLIFLLGNLRSKDVNIELSSLCVHYPLHCSHLPVPPLFAPDPIICSPCINQPLWLSPPYLLHPTPIVNQSFLTWTHLSLPALVLPLPLTPAHQLSPLYP